MRHHTPGPWSTLLDRTFSQVYAQPTNEGIIADVTSQRHLADARLIAAAPDLLAAAQDVVRHLSKMENGRWLNNAPGVRLKQAIALAADA